MKFLWATVVSWAAVLIVVVSAHGPHIKILDPVAYRHHKASSLQDNQANDAGVEGAAEEIHEGDSGKAVIEPMVTIPVLGSAKGSVMKTLFGRDFTGFRSIPYAFKPLRFQYAELYEGESWTYDDYYDATFFRDRCPQHSLIAPVVSGSEDCLHISVYSPLTNFANATKAGLPVMVFIHGGAYMSGEATLYMPSKLLDRDVVVAVVQYRLGTLGFLYSGTADAPGNMGLMDQVLALRWVQKHISYFGGNPDLVTVFGQSAGGASTSWMQITSLTRADNINNDGKDLAHRFIAMSGSALEYWTLEHTPEESFLFQAEAAGCGEAGNTEQIMFCMKYHLTLDEVVWGSLKAYSDDRARGGLGFAGQVPVVQDQNLTAFGIELVIEEPPLDSLRNGRFLQVPTMTGAVRDEGSLVVGLLYDDYLDPNGFADNATYLRDELFPFIAKAFGIDDVTNAVSNSFRISFLPEDVEMGNWDEMVGGLVDLGGMLFLKSGMWTLAHEIFAHNNSVPVFFYSFEFEADDSLFDWIFISSPDLPVEGGISHADDLLYLFNMPSQLDTRQREMSRRMTTLYTNFARYGSPTPPDVAGDLNQWEEFAAEWKPYSSEEPNFMLLKDMFTLESDFTKRWNYNKFGYDSGNSAPAADGETDLKEVVDRVVSQAADHVVSRAQYEDAASEAASYKSATIAFGTVAACAVLALIATLLVTRKRANAHRSSLASADNLAMDRVH